MHELLGHEIFVVDTGGSGGPRAPAVLVLHGFPTCSFDWRHVASELRSECRVVSFDFLGFGLSAKPDATNSLLRQADVVEAVARELELEEVVLVTHDMGSSVGGEICARANAGTLPFQIVSRVVTNGSIYLENMALTPAQEFLLSLPDEKLAAEAMPAPEVFQKNLAGVFGPGTQPSEDELAAHWELLCHADGARLMPRLIRYKNDQRENLARWAEAIERHPAPVSIVWGDVDPATPTAIAERLAQTVAGAELDVLHGIGHYPMSERPAAVTAAIRRAKSRAR